MSNTLILVCQNLTTKPSDETVTVGILCAVGLGWVTRYLPREKVLRLIVTWLYRPSSFENRKMETNNDKIETFVLFCFCFYFSQCTCKTFYLFAVNVLFKPTRIIIDSGLLTNIKY